MILIWFLVINYITSHALVFIEIGAVGAAIIFAFRGSRKKNKSK